MQTTKLWRIGGHRPEYLEWLRTGGLPDPLTILIEDGVLVAVEACDRICVTHNAYEAGHPRLPPALKCWVKSGLRYPGDCQWVAAVRVEADE